MNRNDLATAIIAYYAWIEKCIEEINRVTMHIIKEPDDKTEPRNTDDMVVDGYSIKGQDIEISTATTSVYFQPTLLTFAKWLEQEPVKA